MLRRNNIKYRTTAQREFNLFNHEDDYRPISALFTWHFDPHSKKETPRETKENKNALKAFKSRLIGDR